MREGAETRNPLNSKFLMNSAKPQINRSLTAKNLFMRRGRILGIVLHDTAGSGLHNDTRYLANPGDGRKVSVDFTVERDGSVWQLNPDLKKYCCSHAGRATKFKGYFNASVNHTTVGIEIVQKADLSLRPLYPDAQVKAVADLCVWLCAEFKLDKADITTHRQIITDRSRIDPRQFPFEGDSGFWALFHAAQGTGAKPSPCMASDEHVPEPERFIGLTRAEIDQAVEVSKPEALDVPPKQNPPVSDAAVVSSIDPATQAPASNPQPGFFDTYGQKIDTVTGTAQVWASRADSAKSLWTTVTQVLFQPAWAALAFFYGLPREVWIVVAITVFAGLSFYLYRQITLGKIRESKS
jgi:N-acetyl-anhydromuramyl-L-alanine amidase AmpD